VGEADIVTDRSQKTRRDSSRNGHHDRLQIPLVATNTFSLLPTVVSLRKTTARMALGRYLARPWLASTFFLLSLLLTISPAYAQRTDTDGLSIINAPGPGKLVPSCTNLLCESH
jgi:hypothetical protein